MLLLLYDWYLLLSSCIVNTTNHHRLELSAKKFGVCLFKNRTIIAERMAEKFIEEEINKHDVVIFSKTWCPYCKVAKQIFDSLKQPYTSIELDKRDDGDAIQDALLKMTGTRTVPKVFVYKECIGGSSDVKKLHDENKLVPLLQKSS